MGLIKGFNLGTWADHAAASVGKAAFTVSGIGLMAKGGEAVAQEAGKIPVIGKPFEAVLDLPNEPFKAAQAVANGQNVSKAVLNSFKDTLKDVKEVAPIAQAVISFIPGIGPLASAAISAGLAIAEGKPLDQVLEAAVVGAIPGGAIAAAAYDLGKQAVTGKIKNWASAATTIMGAAADAAGVQIPDAAQKLIGAALHATQSLANGQKPDQVIIQTAIPALGPVIGKQVTDAMSKGDTEGVANILGNSIPGALPHVSKTQVTQIVNALKIGGGMGHAQNLQSAQKAEVTTRVAQGALSASPTPTATEQAVKSTLPLEAQKGFTVGQNVNRTTATAAQLLAVRSALTNSRQQDGFDTAVSLHMGQVMGKPAPPEAKTPAMQAGYAIAQSLDKTDPQHAQNVLSILGAEVLAGTNLHTSQNIMGWGEIMVGSLAGAYVGLQFGGPIGAIAGTVIGGFGIRSLLHGKK